MTSCRVPGWHLATGPSRLYVAWWTGARSSSIAEVNHWNEYMGWLNRARIHTSVTDGKDVLIPPDVVECAALDLKIPGHG